MIILFSILIFTLTISFKILLILFFLVGLLYFFISIITKKFNEKISAKYNFEIENRFKIVNETFFNIKQIIIDRSHSYFLKQFNNSNLRFMKSILKKYSSSKYTWKYNCLFWYLITFNCYVYI